MLPQAALISFENYLSPDGKAVGGFLFFVQGRVPDCWSYALYLPGEIIPKCAQSNIRSKMGGVKGKKN